MELKIIVDQIRSLNKSIAELFLQDLTPSAGYL